MDFHSCPCVFIDLHGHRRISVDIHVFSFLSMDVHVYSYIFMDMRRLPWISMDIHVLQNSSAFCCSSSSGVRARIRQKFPFPHDVESNCSTLSFDCAFTGGDIDVWSNWNSIIMSLTRKTITFCVPSGKASYDFQNRYMALNGSAWSHMDIHFI